MSLRPARPTIKFDTLPGEEWREYTLVEKKNRRYLISNMGRVASFDHDVEKDGGLMKAYSIGRGYKAVRLYYYELEEGSDHKIWKSKQLFVHKAVAELFVAKAKPDQNKVLHLDYDLNNNHANNLKWADNRESFAHERLSPKFKAYDVRRQEKKDAKAKN
jgi:NUMOD4 motif